MRELSQKFDKWSPTSFKLAPAEVERAIGQVPKRDLDYIRFAQAQVRNFAQKQRETLRDLEVETQPGIVLGHKHIPVNSIGCYVPGGRYPMVSLCRSCHASQCWAKPIVIIISDPIDMAPGEPASCCARRARTFSGPMFSSSSYQRRAFAASPPAHLLFS